MANKFKFKLKEKVCSNRGIRTINTKNKDKYGNIFYGFKDYIEGSYQEDINKLKKGKKC